ncbi:MAG: hypothetical protein PVF54_10960 [Anaerolineae bacterium]|jgi:predicted RNase H-like nuclease (RuvC/YqgF family)
MDELVENQETSEAQLQEGQVEEVSPEESQAAEQPQINLDDLPQFRQWKSTMDRKLATERKERERLQQELEENRSMVDELSLRDADPDERVAYYRNKMTQLEEEQRLQAERQQRIAEAGEKADALLEKLGLTRQTPGLDWGGDPLGDGFERLALSAVDVASRNRSMGKQEVEAKVREAKQAAVKQTGAAVVSTAKEGSGPSLRAEYEKARAKLKGTGDIRALINLKDEFREKGLEDL